MKFSKFFFILIIIFLIFNYHYNFENVKKNSLWDKFPNKRKILEEKFDDLIYWSLFSKVFLTTDSILDIKKIKAKKYFSLFETIKEFVPLWIYLSDNILLERDFDKNKMESFYYFMVDSIEKRKNKERYYEYFYLLILEIFNIDEVMRLIEKIDLSFEHISAFKFYFLFKFKDKKNIFLKKAKIKDKFDLLKTKEQWYFSNNTYQNPLYKYFLFGACTF